MIRSCTSKPASFLIVCSLLIISRTNPSSTSSSVRFVSSTTVISRSLSETKPSFCAVSTSTSASSSVISLPSRLKVTLPSRLKQSISSLPSAADRYSPIFGTSFPYFGPTVLSWGLNLYVVKPEASSVNTICLTFSSSFTRSAYMPGSSSLSFMNIVPMGWRFLIFAAFLQARPSTTYFRTLSMFSSSSLSMNPSLAAGKSHRCTLSGAEGSTLLTRFRYICSLMKGTNGAMVFESSTSTV